MDNKADNDITNNPFLSRGCREQPKYYNFDNRKISCSGCTKLNSYDWLNSIKPPPGQEEFDCVEVRFKNSRKEFFRINTEYEIGKGDIVATEASPGHDIGIVSLVGESARLQMRKKGVDHKNAELRKVYRKARATDIEKWITSVDQENKTMFRSRLSAGELQLDMKISDVEYQGDGTKAIFYYTAEDRIDFRELIKVLAEVFKVRIEMRQIGVRQEASRLGGIGSCGRELCCSTWLSDFRSVTTQAARAQQLALNPQKLAGQCSKLKCCINYEYDVYVEANKEFPDQNIPLKSKRGTAFFQKLDTFKKIMWYSYENEHSMMTLPVDQVWKIIAMNKKGKFPEKLEDFTAVQEAKVDFQNSLNEGDINRFNR